MMKAKKYYYKNTKGEVVSTMGIELDKTEQQKLCQDNLRRIKYQCREKESAK